jgi:PIN domain nuclease of toxin-antitoxin system
LKYLLDTNTFLWIAGDPDRLSEKAMALVISSENRLYLSAASGWEMALLHRFERVVLPDEPRRFVPEAMQRLNVQPISIGFSTAVSAALLPLIHRDPFDRIIIAEAMKEKMAIISKDKKMAEYGVQTIW